MLSKSFKAGKCKTSLKLAMARVKVLKYKTEAEVKQMKRELALILEAGQEQTARIRVEHVIREEKTMAAYDIIKLYCELIVAQLPVIESQKNCPIDLKEAISSVIFASARCAGIPELQDVRKHFIAKYGKEFTTAALELRPECRVNHTNGPNVFVTARRMPRESHNIQSQPPASQNHEPATKYSDNDATRSSPGSRTFSSTNVSTPTASVPTTSRSRSRTSESKAGQEDFRNSFQKDENRSMNRWNWNMQFPDAATAAQEAAESAERASIAARAAAELSSREKIKREYSTSLDELPRYGLRDEGSGRPTSSMQRGEDVEVLGKMEADHSYWMKTMSQDQNRDQIGQHCPLGAAESRYDDPGSVKSRTSRSVSSHSSVTSLDDDSTASNLQNSQKSSFRAEAVDLNCQRRCSEMGAFHGERDGVVGSIQKQSSRSVSFHSSTSSVKDYPVVDRNTQKYGNDADGQSSISTRLGIAKRGSNQPILSDFSAPAFDNSDTDGDSDLEFDGDSNRHESRFPLKGTKPPSHLSSNMDSWSPQQQKSQIGYIQSDSPRMHFVEPQLQNIFPTRASESKVPSQSDDLSPEASDDLDDLLSSSEEETNKFNLRERTEPGISHLKQTISTRSSSSAQTGRRPAEFSFHEKKEPEGVNRNAWSNAPDDSETEMPSPHTLLSNQLLPRHPKSPRKSCNVDRKTFYRSEVEEQPSLLSSRLVSAKEVRTMDTSEELPSPASTKNSEVPSYSSNESGNDSNLGRLMGGLRNKGLSRPPYMGNHPADTSLSSKQKTVEETPATFQEPPSGFPSVKSSLSSEPRNHELYNQKPHIKVPKTLIPTTFDSNSDDAKEVQPNQTVGNGGYQGNVRSCRARDSMFQSAKGNPLRFTDRSGAPVQSDFGAGSRLSQPNSSMAEPLSKPLSQTPVAGSRENSISSQPNSSAKRQSSNPLPHITISTHKESAKSVAPSSEANQPPKTVTSGSNGTPKPGSLNEGSTSRENSLKSLSHVHPKLPDYDTLKAQFELLRTNRRSQ
ncbi:uncharacterized protein LOC131222841 isoform X2 [Magnolia sinica]|uniref:uncharacterized protein LOC131222841 isoform X2 n=1 Tax=Magnolia sinica TaxID=86752 RepID=UPI00265A5219|nr:uncharacterized protein LOC131222841 isoform X2 [Magnolia sinica]